MWRVRCLWCWISVSPMNASGGYIVNSLDCYSYSLIGKLTVLFKFQEFIFRNMTVDSYTSTAPCSLPSYKLKSTVPSSRM